MEQQNNEYKFPIKEIIVIIGALIYFLSPIDIVPDVILGFGQLDDLVLGLYAFSQAKKIFKDYNQYKNNKAKPKKDYAQPIEVESKTIDDEE